MKKFPRSKFKESLIKNKSITDKETQHKTHLTFGSNSILTNISPGVGRRDSEGTVGTAKSAGVERPGTDPYTGCPRVERLQKRPETGPVVCWVRTAGCCRQQLNGSKLGKWKGSIWE